jgi:hypothetical protein
MMAHRSQDGEEQSSPSPWAEADCPPYGASLTPWDDEGGGQRTAITGAAIASTGAMPACGSANAMASVIAYVMAR